MKKGTIFIILLVLLLLVSCGGNPASGSGTDVVTEGDKQIEKSEPIEKALGTRQNPVPSATEVKVGDNWHITVVEIIPDAWPIIKEVNMFNDPPEEGKQFVLANIRFSYMGEESGTPWLDLTVKYLGADSNTYSSGESGVLPKPYHDIGEQFPGATAEGQVAWSVPADVIVGGMIIIEESFSFDDTRVFFEGAK